MSTEVCYRRIWDICTSMTGNIFSQKQFIYDISTWSWRIIKEAQLFSFTFSKPFFWQNPLLCSTITNISLACNSFNVNSHFRSHLLVTLPYNKPNLYVLFLNVKKLMKVSIMCLEVCWNFRTCYEHDNFKLLHLLATLDLWHMTIHETWLSTWHMTIHGSKDTSMSFSKVRAPLLTRVITWS